MRFDGRNRKLLHRGDRVVVSASASCIPTLNMKPRQEEWFDSIVASLNWNARSQQKPMGSSVTRALI